MTGLYRIAEKNVEIVSRFEDVHALCRDYKAEGDADLNVTIREEDVERERLFADAPYPDGYLETLAVYRKIAETMPQWNVFLIHGSAVAADGIGYLFTAPSGTGKSTHARLWRELLGARAAMINDDKPLARVGAETIDVFGTPWNGKHRLGENAHVPLKAVCFLEQAPENSIVRLSAAEGFSLLLGQVYRPRDVSAMKKTLTLLDETCRRVRIYRLRCNMELDAARLSFKKMSED